MPASRRVTSERRRSSSLGAEKFAEHLPVQGAEASTWADAIGSAEAGADEGEEGEDKVEVLHEERRAKTLTGLQPRSTHARRPYTL